MMQQTSLEAYENIKNTGQLGRRQEEIFIAFHTYGPHTNLEISELIGLPINQVTPRVLELRKRNVLVLDSERPCEVSGRSALVWKVSSMI